MPSSPGMPAFLSTGSERLRLEQSQLRRTDGRISHALPEFRLDSCVRGHDVLCVAGAETGSAGDSDVSLRRRAMLAG